MGLENKLTTILYFTSPLNLHRTGKLQPSQVLLLPWLYYHVRKL